MTEGKTSEPTTGIHLRRALSHSYSVPSSVSSKNLLSTFENETRSSASKSEGDTGKPEGCPSFPFFASAMTTVVGDVVESQWRGEVYNFETIRRRK